MFASRTALAWKSFSHHKLTMLASVGGVAFAVLLMFVEMGFLNGMFDSHTHVVETMDADLLIVNVDKAAVIPRLSFARRHMFTARATAGVATVTALRVDEMRSMFKNLKTRKEHPILVYGCDPEHPPFKVPGLAEAAPELRKLDTVLIDDLSKGFYGKPAVGSDIEILGRRLRVAGHFSLGPDFRADGNAMLSERTFLDLYAAGRMTEVEQIDFALIKLQPGADRDAVQRELTKRLPPDVSVLTLDEFSTRIRRFWGQSKPVGFVFGLGLAVGFFIGMTICYQILYVDITNHLPQYATLKAIGYGNDYLLKLVLRQAMYLAVMGFGAGLLASRAAYFAVEYFTQVPMFFTPIRVGSVALLTLVMCLVSGFIAIGKALDLDPADVF